MKIYLALIRVVLFCTAFGSLITGGLFYMQNWEGWRFMLGAGVVLSAFILLDIFRTKKFFNKIRN